MHINSDYQKQIFYTPFRDSNGDQRYGTLPLLNTNNPDFFVGSDLVELSHSQYWNNSSGWVASNKSNLAPNFDPFDIINTPTPTDTSKIPNYHHLQNYRDFSMDTAAKKYSQVNNQGYQPD